MALAKLEGRITVPTGGWSIQVTDSGGTQTVVVAAAGDYYLNSATNLLTTIGTALTANVTLAGTYTLTSDDNASASTGKTTITITGGGAAPSITWTSTALRDALGFTGNLTGAATYISTKSSTYLFLPDVRRANPMAPDGSAGVPLSDASFTVAPTGKSKVIRYALRYHDNLEFAFLGGQKTYRDLEVTGNESLQSFFETVISVGIPFNYHPDRSDDATFVPYRSSSPHDFMVKPEFPGLVGTKGVAGSGTGSRWHYGPSDVIKYV